MKKTVLPVPLAPGKGSEKKMSKNCTIDERWVKDSMNFYEKCYVGKQKQARKFEG
jgi:hypothetical protein